MRSHDCLYFLFLILSTINQTLFFYFTRHLRYPHVERPFRVPVSDRGFAVLGAICFAWVLLGSWVAVFPGTLEAAFGIDYPFEEYWGVSQARFEVFTLGTLAVLLVLGVVGYVRGARVRRDVGATATTPAPTPQSLIEGITP